MEDYDIYRTPIICKLAAGSTFIHRREQHADAAASNAYAHGEG